MKKSTILWLILGGIGLTCILLIIHATTNLNWIFYVELFMACWILVTGILMIFSNNTPDSKYRIMIDHRNYYVDEYEINDGVIYFDDIISNDFTVKER